MEQEKIRKTTLTMKETAEYLGVSYWLVNRLVRIKQLPSVRVGGKILFRREALDRYLIEQEEASTTKDER
ncbi:MAG: helix-turn-helix domain-containing protein [Clostridia bacterium]|nr:helix-turn-helix domain-containing protein [Clostridia bacterium]